LGRKILDKMSVGQGVKYSSPTSVSDIPSFVKFHHINMEESLNDIDSFENFNDFFTRKLKPEVRPIDPDENVVVSPADCRLHVFLDVNEAIKLWIKGRDFSISKLIDNEELSKDFEGCSVVIARLAPQDYHRFHFPIGGHVGHVVDQGHSLYSVNPIGVRGPIDVYCENKRKSVVIESELFGKMMYIAIGATLVGSVVLTSEEDSVVNKGDEHGYFAFGGSTLLLLFQKNKVIFDNDIILNSQNQVETYVQMGTRIGRASNLNNNNI
jgi:phosphatidylserine decarboxylase